MLFQWGVIRNGYFSRLVTLFLNANLLGDASLAVLTHGIRAQKLMSLGSVDLDDNQFSRDAVQEFVAAIYSLPLKINPLFISPHDDVVLARQP